MEPASTLPSPPQARRFRRTAGTAILTVELYDEQGLAVDHDRLGRLALHALVQRGVPSTQVDVSLVDIGRMRELNEDHMGHEGPTDVLAFPLDDPVEPSPASGAPSLLGDVVVCPEVARRQGGQTGHGGPAELELLLVHGILHLLGHDHAEEGERATMFTLTDDILAAFRRSEAGSGQASDASASHEAGDVR